MRNSPSWLSPWGVKWAFLLTALVVVSASNVCQSKLKPDLNNLIEFTVADKEKLDVEEFKIVLKEGENFNHILTPECDPKQFPVLSAEFREEGMEDWYEANIYGISNHKRGKSSLNQKRTEGKIRLKDIKGDEKLRELNFCKIYEIRLKVNKVSGEEIVKAGPFKDKFTPEELLELNEDASDNEKEMTLKYEALENGVKVSWDNVCAQSAKIYAKIGDEGMKETKAVKDLSENSFTMETKPCNLYLFEIDFFLSHDPDQKDYGALYRGINEFISPPKPETFADIKMDESSKKLTWDFSQYRGFANDPEITGLCIKQKGLKYKITFETLDGQESDVLEEEDSPKVDSSYTFDVLGAIQKKSLTLRKCEQYKVKLEISYITAMGKSLSRVFEEPFSTNHDGTLEEKDEDVNKMTKDGNEIKIKFGSCVKENPQAVFVDMGENLAQPRISGSIESAKPRIISSKETSINNPMISITELVTEDLKPCVSYSIQLLTEEQKNELLQSITDNNHISNLADQIDIDIRGPWGKPTLTLEGSNLKVEDTEANNRCHKEAYKIECLDTAQNESSVEETIHPPTNISMAEANFTAGTDLTCKVKILYQAQGGDQASFESEWSEALTFTVPEATTEPPATQPSPVILDNYDEVTVPKVEGPVDPTTPGEPNTKADSKTSQGSPVGIVVGVVVGLILVGLAGAAFVMYRKKNASAGGDNQVPNLSHRASATKSEATVEMGPSPLANTDVKPEENETLLTEPKADVTATEASVTPDVSIVD